MNDPRPAMNSADPFGTSSVRSRAAMAETLQQALRSFSGDPSALAGGAMTPDVLRQLAQSAGITNNAQLNELARMLGVSLGANGAEGISVPQNIIFALNENECTFPAGSVQGVERITDISTVPNTVPWVLGIIHLRGSILSVVDLRGFFGLPTQPLTQRSRLLVVNRREMTIGLMVDGVNEMRLIDTEQEVSQMSTVPAWSAAYATGMINIEGRPVILLDPDRLLFADKMHRYHA
jgi:purine-binding chemotaxis protein CheW